MSQKEQLLKHLQTDTITSREAYEKLGITQLATRVSELKSEGCNISSKDRIKVPNRQGEMVEVVNYRLIQPGHQAEMFEEKTKSRAYDL